MTIDIDEIERIAKAGDPWGYAATPANILALIAEVRALREDAQRWHLVRDQASIYQGNNIGCFVEFKKYEATPSDRPRSGQAFIDEVDAAIDAARKEKA